MAVKVIRLTRQQNITLKGICIDIQEQGIRFWFRFYLDHGFNNLSNTPNLLDEMLEKGMVQHIWPGFKLYCSALNNYLPPFVVLQTGIENDFIGIFTILSK